MRSLRALSVAALAVLFGAGGSLAGPADAPDRYAAGIDGPVVSIVQPGTGITFSAWAFRGRGEYDIAVSSRDAAGPWSEPVYLGRNDGRDEVSPAIVADDQGTLYLAFTIRETAQIQLSILRPGASGWTAALPVTGSGERCFAPALAVVGNRLVLAWRTFGGVVQIRELPLVSSAKPTGINDGPDGVDPLGARPANGGGTSGTPERFPGVGAGK